MAAFHPGLAHQRRHLAMPHRPAARPAATTQLMVPSDKLAQPRAAAACKRWRAGRDPDQLEHLHGLCQA